MITVSTSHLDMNRFLFLFGLLFSDSKMLTFPIHSNVGFRGVTGNHIELGHILSVRKLRDGKMSVALRLKRLKNRPNCAPFLS